MWKRYKKQKSSSITAEYFQTEFWERVFIVILSAKMWGGWKLFCLHKKQLNALFLSFLVKTCKGQQKWTGIVFRSRFCISVIMSQRFILSFFVLAPTHNVNVRVTLLLPAPSSTQPKGCFDQVLKCAGGVLAPTNMPQHSQGCWALDVVFVGVALGKRGQNPFLIFRKSHIDSGLALKCWDTMATLVFQENRETFWFKEEKSIIQVAVWKVQVGYQGILCMWQECSSSGILEKTFSPDLLQQLCQWC